MGPSTMVSGTLEELMEKVFSLIPRVNATKETGGMIKLRAMESIRTQIMLNMRVSGIRTCNMEKDLRNGKMVQYFQENIEMGKKMELESMNGEMEPLMKGSGKIMKFQAMVITHGQMEESMLDTGRAT